MNIKKMNIKNRSIIVALFIIVCLTLSLSLQSCSCNSKIDSNIPEYDGTGGEVDRAQDAKESVSYESGDSTADIDETQPDDSSKKETESDVQTEEPSDYFEFNESGRIVGSIQDCETVEVSIGDKTFTLKEYFDDPKSYYEYFELCYKDLAIQYDPYLGADGENVGFHYSFEDKAQDEALFITMCSFGFEYGCRSVVPEKLNLIDYSVNGVALGDSVENVFAVLGNPHDEFLSENDYHILDNYTVSYYFEESNPNVGWARDTVSFHIIDGKVSNILCATYMYF